MNYQYLQKVCDNPVWPRNRKISGLVHVKFENAIAALGISQTACLV